MAAIVYDDQALNNMVCLFEDIEYHERKEVFFKLIEQFEKNNVGWALGCSMNLFIRGIIDDFHDLDLIVDIADIDTIRNIMENEEGAVLTETGGNGFYESDVYLHYQLNRVDVGIISGFKIITFGTTYYYPYKASQVDIVDVMDTKVPLISLEAMYILYYMMEGWQPRRQFKRKLIEEFFRYEEPRHMEVLKEAIEQNRLPGPIKWAVKRLLKDY